MLPTSHVLHHLGNLLEQPTATPLLQQPSVAIAGSLTAHVHWPRADSPRTSLGNARVAASPRMRPLAHAYAPMTLGHTCTSAPLRQVFLATSAWRPLAHCKFSRRSQLGY